MEKNQIHHKYTSLLCKSVLEYFCLEREKNWFVINSDYVFHTFGAMERKEIVQIEATMNDLVVTTHSPPSLNDLTRVWSKKYP